MPSSKRREFDDTWKKEELEKSLKGSKDDKRRPKDRDRDKSRKREDEDRHHRRKEDDEKRDRRRGENGESEKRDKHKSSRHKDDDEDREKKHRRHRDENDEDREKRHRRHRDENDEDREKRHRRHRDDDEGDRDRHRRHRDENDEDRERRHRRHRDEHDEDRERRHRRHKDGEGDGDRKHKRREETEEERRKRKEKEREKRHREENGERRRHRDDDRKDDRRSKRGDDDEEERRRRHEERKKEREREKQRQKEKEREKENERQRQREKERERESEKDRDKKQREREKRDREKKEEKQEEAEGGDDDDDYNYEEDFEDYDDDFEDDEDDGDDKDDTASNKTPNEVDDVLKAMNEENERLMRDSQKMKKDPSPYNSYDEEEEEEKSRYRSRPKTAQRTFINFVSAKQREITGKAASKTVRRFKELRELVELDVARFDLFDMPPVNEYELYMRSFGSSNTRQAYVQTNEDNIDREIQTEELETREIWVQNTPDSVDNVGGPDFEKKEDEFAQISKQESAKRALMWERTVNAFAILLEEDAAERIHGSSEDRKQSNICLSEAFQEVEIESFSLLKDRTVIYSHFSPVQTHMLLTVHKSKHNQPNSPELSNKGILCVWNVNSPNCPQKVLLCESQPRCCCFSPNKATLAFAGMHDGSVLVWDLRESSNMHKDYTDGDKELVLRYPTYSTAGILQYDNHQSAVIAIQPILAPNQSGGASEVNTASEDGGEGLSFQVATLEQHSVINLWVVAEITHTDPAGSESDLGLSPGGRVKLIKSSTIQLESPLRDARLRTTMQAFDMKLLPSNNSHFYVSTDSGSVIHGVRYGGKAPPKAHQPESESPIRVTSIDFSPFPEPVFLAGCEDGTLRLHHTDCEYPLITWPDATGGVCIEAVRWCRSRPSVFFVLDTESRMHIWDLLMSDAVPMKFEKIADERVTSIDLSNDHSATGVGLPGRKPQMVISLESGSTEVHTLSREFSALMGDELDQFKRLIQRIT